MFISHSRSSYKYFPRVFLFIPFELIWFGQGCLPPFTFNFKWLYLLDHVLLCHVFAAGTRTVHSSPVKPPLSSHRIQPTAMPLDSCMFPCYFSCFCHVWFLWSWNAFFIDCVCYKIIWMMQMKGIIILVFFIVNCIVVLLDLTAF